MEYLARFPTPVVYQPDHPIARREVTELVVSAPTMHGAYVHAARVVQGDVSGMTIEPYIPVPVTPQGEVRPDPPPQLFEVGAVFARV